MLSTSYHASLLSRRLAQESYASLMLRLGRTGITWGYGHLGVKIGGAGLDRLGVPDSGQFLTLALIGCNSHLVMNVPRGTQLATHGKASQSHTDLHLSRAQHEVLHRLLPTDLLLRILSTPGTGARALATYGKSCRLFRQVLAEACESDAFILTEAAAHVECLRSCRDKHFQVTMSDISVALPPCRAFTCHAKNLRPFPCRQFRISHPTGVED